MAFPAKDGTMHTNADSMRTRNAMSSAPEPQAEGGEHDAQGLDQLKQAFDEVMMALASGQKPDPQTVKDLIQYFNQFIQEEEQEGGGEESGEPWEGGQ